MKRVIVVMLLLCSMNVFAQQPYERDSVIQVQGKTTEQIYNGLKTWFIENAKYDSRNIVQVDNPKDGIIIGKGSIKIELGGMKWRCLSGYITFLVDTRIKDGRFKVHMYQFTHDRLDPRWGESWSQGLIYAQVPEERQRAFKWGAYCIIRSIPTHKPRYKISLSNRK